MDISPGGWVGRKSKCSRPLSVAARRLRALVAPFGLGRAGHGSSLLNTQWALTGARLPRPARACPARPRQPAPPCPDLGVSRGRWYTSISSSIEVDRPSQAFNSRRRDESGIPRLFRVPRWGAPSRNQPRPCPRPACPVRVLFVTAFKIPGGIPVLRSAIRLPTNRVVSLRRSCDGCDGRGVQPRRPGQAACLAGQAACLASSILE